MISKSKSLDIKNKLNVFWRASKDLKDLFIDTDTPANGK